ncbi:MAG: DUF2752 domain-containing protein [Gemmataceae bacterium]
MNTPADDDDPGYELVPDPLPIARRAGLPRWVRGVLALMAAGFTAVFAVALWLNPYRADGTRREMATHTQLGLPPCTMVQALGKPCPSCGMTTSFALLAHGDLAGSLKANWVGTLLAAYWFALIPWAAVGAWRGRYPWIRSGEMLLTVSVAVLLVLLLVRWAVVMLL